MQEFSYALEENLLAIAQELRGGKYLPDAYVSFYVRDPKLRHIHKASVRDRLVHQALFRVLYPLFDLTFIYDSYSCRVGKGTHRGVRRLEAFARKASANHTRIVYALQCDIRKFFDCIDHGILTELLRHRVADPDTQGLIADILSSFESSPGKGLPLGNVTSQLFANVYLNEFDHWAKHSLKARFYIRYCDDFVILHESSEHLRGIIPSIQKALANLLRLELHPRKTSIRKLRQGIDFLGYVVRPHATTLRTKTKRRMLRKLNARNAPSYLGMLSHADAHKIRAAVLERLRNAPPNADGSYAMREAEEEYP